MLPTPSTLVEPHCGRFVRFDASSSVEKVSEACETISVAKGSAAFKGCASVCEVASLFSSVSDLEKGSGVYH